MHKVPNNFSYFIFQWTQHMSGVAFRYFKKLWLHSHDTYILFSSPMWCGNHRNECHFTFRLLSVYDYILLHNLQGRRMVVITNLRSKSLSISWDRTYESILLGLLLASQHRPWCVEKTWESDSLRDFSSRTNVYYSSTLFYFARFVYFCLSLYTSISTSHPLFHKHTATKDALLSLCLISGEKCTTYREIFHRLV